MAILQDIKTKQTTPNYRHVRKITRIYHNNNDQKNTIPQINVA